MSKTLYLALSPDSYKNIVSAFPELETHTLVILDDLSIGPLHLDYSRRTDKAIPYTAIRRTKQAWETLAQSQCDIVVWYGNCPVEACALMATIYMLKDVDSSISLRTPFESLESFVSFCDHSPEEIREMRFYNRTIDHLEQEQSIERWQRLVEENSALRVNKNGMVVSVSETYFDYILDSNDDICSASYEIRMQYGYYFNWSYLKCRKSILSQ